MATAYELWHRLPEFPDLEDGPVRTQAANIDAHLAGTASFWDICETYCVADCRGVWAFEFTEENIQKVLLASSWGREDLIQALETLHHDIECNVARFGLSERMEKWMRG